MKTLAVMSGKGGVGKSTIAANLAALISKEHKVGILDTDFHGPTIPKILDIEEEALLTTPDGEIEPVKYNENLQAVSIDLMQQEEDQPTIWRGPLKMKVIKEFSNEIHWDESTEYLIIDLPPGTGDEPLSVAQEFQGIDGAIIVTTPQDVALKSVRKSVNFAKRIDLEVIGVIQNMNKLKCPNCGEEIKIFGSGGGVEMSKELDIPFLGSLPLDPEIMQSGEKGKPFVEEDTKLKESMETIFNNVKDILGEKNK
ncbi:MAG: Mrp family protein, ATPase, containing iron-sulfur cluster [Candidatus Methanohalarchaeum thermophilum]|uniref:Iron-sulfur cluster carrier protein n=1 Tax=Methanohalarchaeum thermophilum TaxID=1903181 RepID=A0A1Q6DU74_METT1|nr:MAG: Mrp family protein, ATPase, containing iron-sulfur cluster [Candidatus Methanohalarchaeum thermophilum]